MDGYDIGIGFVMLGKAFQYSAGDGEEAGRPRCVERSVVFGDGVLTNVDTGEPLLEMFKSEYGINGADEIGIAAFGDFGDTGADEHNEHFRAQFFFQDTAVSDHRRYHRR